MVSVALDKVGVPHCSKSHAQVRENTGYYSCIHGAIYMKTRKTTSLYYMDLHEIGFGLWRGTQSKKCGINTTLKHAFRGSKLHFNSPYFAVGWEETR